MANDIYTNNNNPFNTRFEMKNSIKNSLNKIATSKNILKKINL